MGTKKRKQPAVLAAIFIGLLVVVGGFYWFERAFIKAAPWLGAVRNQPLGDLTFELPANLKISHSSWAFQPRNDLWPHMTVVQEFAYPIPAGPAVEEGETGRAGIERAYLAQAAEFSSRQSWPGPTQNDLADLAGRPATLIRASALDQSQQRAYLLVWFPDGYLELIKHGFNRPDQPSHCQRLANYSGRSAPMLGATTTPPRLFIPAGANLNKPILRAAWIISTLKLNYMTPPRPKESRRSFNSAMIWNFWMNPCGLATPFGGGRSTW